MNQYMLITHILILCHAVYHAAAKRPHILLILADDYGWNDIGYHGSTIQTPTLDKLAHDGVKLENYYVQPICSPSRSQLLSGRYQIHTGLQHDLVWPGKPFGLPLSLPTLADKLSQTGYSTHMIGKWHLGFCKKEYMPTYRGFDTYYGYLTGAEDYYKHTQCYTFSVDNSSFTSCGNDFRDNMKPLNVSGLYSTQLFAKRAEQIAAQHAMKNTEQPIFIYLPFQAVHAPMQVPENYMKKYSYIKNSYRRIYAGMVSALDEAVANITNAFKKYGLWEDTLVVFSTDNGGEIHTGGNNWPLRGWKHSLWEGGVRGVSFVSGPFLPRSQGVIRDLMHITDWYPTLLGLAGGNTSGMMLDGYDIWPTLSEGSPGARQELLHNIEPMFAKKGKALANSTFDTTTRSAIRRGPWKLITGDPGDSTWVPPPTTPDDSEHLDLSKVADDPNKNLWLFNLETDPFETTDVSMLHPDVVTQLLGRLSYYNTTAVPPIYPPDDPNADPRKHGGWWGPWLD